MDRFTGSINWLHNYLICLYGADVTSAYLKKRLLRKSDSEVRREIAWVNSYWGMRALRDLSKRMGMRVDVHHPPEMEECSDTPFIIVPNHISMMDIYFICRFMFDAGRRNLRWVMAEHVRRFAVIGKFAELQGSAFISRTGSEDDIKSLKRSARIIHEDRADIVIFPEGKRHSRERVLATGQTYRNLLPPHVRGLKILREALPDHKILSLTFKLTTPRPTEKVVTPKDFIGSHLRITGSIHDVKLAEITDWLNDEWQRKDLELGMNHQSLMP